MKPGTLPRVGPPARRVPWTAGLLISAGLLGVGGASPARAEPAFAVRTGYRCSQCHVNRTGGGLRTSFGSIYTQTVLPARTFKWRDEGNLIPANPDARFAFGANVRVQYLGVFRDEGKDTGSFELPEANAYLRARLLPGKLDLYLDETLGPGGASTRELFGLFSFRGNKRAYIKAGKFLPAYGWRLPDDNAYIRQFTGFSYSAPDTGIEFGLEPGRWSIHLGAINGKSGGGSDDNDEKKFTALAVRRFRTWRIGVSGANNIDDNSRTSQAGALAGVNFGRVALLGEADWIESRTDESTRRLIGFLEADVLLSRGLNLKIAHDWLDPDTDLDTDERTRDSLGIEYIPYPFVQLRAFVRTSDGPPQVPGARDDQVEFELHLFF